MQTRPGSRHLFTKGGTDRKSRISPLLETGRVVVDGFGLHRQIAKAAAMARTMAYYDSNNRADGNWEDFFLSDETLLLGTMAGFNTAHLKIVFHQSDPDVRSDRTEQYDLCCALKNQIDTWLERFSAMDSKTAGEMRAFLETVIRRLPPLTLQDDMPINRVFYGLIDAVNHIQQAAASKLISSMAGAGHDPGAGLFIAFLKLMEQVRNRANRFPDRYLDFYYHDVLKAKPRSGQPDSTFLVFRADRDAGQVHVEQGTPFICEYQDNIPKKLYTTDEAVTVSDVEVAGLAFLYFDKNPLISPENKMGFVTGVFQQTLTPGLKTDMQMKDPVSSVPLFGTAQSDPGSGSKPGHSSPAVMGMAVASPVLLLRQGERRITVTIDYTIDRAAGPDITVMLENRLEDRDQDAPGDQGLKTRHLNIRDLEIRDLFFKVFDRAVTIFLTGENGWIRMDDISPLHRIVEPGMADKRLSFEFTLCPDHDSVVPWDSLIHGGQYQTGEPVLRMELNPEAHACLYSFFKNMALVNIRIDVAVNGLKDLILYSDTGRMSPAGVFAPFGPLPHAGSSFIFGNFETSNKNINHMDLSLEWDLPRQGMRFSEYYDGYQKAGDTRFRVKVSTLVDGTLQPENPEKQPVFDLFCDVDCKTGTGAGFNSRLSSKSTFGLNRRDIRLFRQKSHPVSEDTFLYDASSRYGFIKFTLCEPEWGFGHRDYPTLLSRSLTRNALLKKAKLPNPLPSPPWTPMIRKISLDYSASSVITPGEEHLNGSTRAGNRFYHLHPWGMETLSKSHGPGPVRFLPWFFEPPEKPDKEGRSFGSLFISLTAGTLPERLTLFFHLKDDARAVEPDDTTQFKWHFLCNNSWKQFEPYDILSDTTHGFLSSGIVTLALSPDMTLHHTIMPGDRYWLMVSAWGNLKSLCSLYGVYTHAAAVTRSSEPETTNETAGRIKTAAISIPGINGIFQAAHFFGNRAAETRDDLKNRIRERLRHKNRAVTAWDYERLILEYFPDIFKVKCFTSFTADRADKFTPDFKNNISLSTRPGHVLIVVVPGIGQKNSDKSLRPMLSRIMLEQIRTFLIKHAPHHAEISVRNPVYEEIQVRCHVKFTGRSKTGEHVRQLNTDISEYLSPWSDIGYKIRFGWRIRPEEVQAFIGGLSYVEKTSGFSMLKITDKTRDYYDLQDTEDKKTNFRKGRPIRPFYPWSIIVPSREHFIEVMTDRRNIPARAAGINDLEIGTTFIIDR